MTFEELQNKITELNFSNIKHTISNSELGFVKVSLSDLKRLYFYDILFTEMTESKDWKVNIQNSIDEDALMTADLSYEYDDGNDQ